VNASSRGALHEYCGGGRRRDLRKSTAASTGGGFSTRYAPPILRMSICAPLTVCHVISAPCSTWQAALAPMTSSADGAEASLHQ